MAKIGHNKTANQIKPRSGTSSASRYGSYPRLEEGDRVSRRRAFFRRHIGRIEQAGSRGWEAVINSTEDRTAAHVEPPVTVDTNSKCGLRLLGDSSMSDRGSTLPKAGVLADSGNPRICRTRASPARLCCTDFWDETRNRRHPWVTSRCFDRLSDYVSKGSSKAGRSRRSSSAARGMRPARS